MTTSNRQPALTIQIYIFLFFLLGYLMITSGMFWEYDSNSVFALTKQLVDHGKLAVDCSLGIKGLANQCYPRYGIFMSLIIIPLYLVEKLSLDVLKITYFPPKFFPSLLNCFISAGLMVLIYQYLRKMEFGKKISFFVTLIFGWATFVPIYTKSLFPEPLLALLIFSGFYLILFCNQERKIYLAAGLLFGLSFLTRVTSTIIFPVLLYVFLSKKISLKLLGYFFLVFFAAVMVFLVYNQMRFGKMLSTGYQPIFDSRIFDGLYLYFFSPGKSIFLYQPIIIFSLLGMKKFFLAKKQIFITFFLLTVTHILFYAKYTCIAKYACAAGDLAWGPRFLYPTIPFFIFALAYFLKDIKHGIMRLLFLLMVFLSFVIQFSAFAFSFHRYFSYLDYKYQLQMYEKIYTVPAYSPLIGQWKLIFKSPEVQNNKKALAEAFRDYPRFDIEKTVGPFDFFFFRTKTGALIGFMLIAIQIFLLKKIIL